MTSDVIRRDLERKLMQNWESFIEREINIASQVLPPADLATMMLGLACTAVCTTGATVGNMVAQAGGDPGSIYDMTVTQIASRALNKKSEALDRIARAQKAAG